VPTHTAHAATLLPWTLPNTHHTHTPYPTHTHGFVHWLLPHTGALQHYLHTGDTACVYLPHTLPHTTHLPLHPRLPLLHTAVATTHARALHYATHCPHTWRQADLPTTPATTTPQVLGFAHWDTRRLGGCCRTPLRIHPLGSWTYHFPSTTLATASSHHLYLLFPPGGLPCRPCGTQADTHYSLSRHLRPHHAFTRTGPHLHHTVPTSHWPLPSLGPGNTQTTTHTYTTTLPQALCLYPCVGHTTIYHSYHHRLPPPHGTYFHITTHTGQTPFATFTVPTAHRTPYHILPHHMDDTPRDLPTATCCSALHFGQTFHSSPILFSLPSSCFSHSRDTIPDYYLPRFSREKRRWERLHNMQLYHGYLAPHTGTLAGCHHFHRAAPYPLNPATPLRAIPFTFLRHHMPQTTLPRLAFTKRALRYHPCHLPRHTPAHTLHTTHGTTPPCRYTGGRHCYLLGPTPTFAHRPTMPDGASWTWDMPTHHRTDTPHFTRSGRFLRTLHTVTFYIPPTHGGTDCCPHTFHLYCYMAVTACAGTTGSFQFTLLPAGSYTGPACAPTFAVLYSCRLPYTPTAPLPAHSRHFPAWLPGSAVT